MEALLALVADGFLREHLKPDQEEAT